LIPEPSTRRRLAPAERASLIRETALELFATSHFSIVNVRQIALACKVNVALIYHYFDDKDHLFRSVLAYAIERLMVGFEALRDPAEDDPAAVIDAWLKAQVKMAPMLVQMVKIMADYAALGVHDAEVDAMIKSLYAREQKLLQQSLARGIAQGQFRDVDAARTARFVGRQLDGIFHASTTRGGGSRRIAQDIAELREFLWHFVGHEPARHTRARAKTASARRTRG
jgi:TetR/AcrR family transcriptional regulator, cholesterol catabolism regulator